VFVTVLLRDCCSIDSQRTTAAATAAGTTGAVTASGMSVLNLSGTLTADRAYVVPLSNKSVTFTVLATDGTNAVADYPLIFTTSMVR
jgi:hypothetical protein